MKSEKKRRYSRHINQQLLIRIANHLGLLRHPLRPRLLDHGARRARRGFVERFDLVKVDLLVQRVLQGGRDVVRVVVVVVSAVAVAVGGVFVVAVVGHFFFGGGGGVVLELVEWIEFQREVSGVEFVGELKASLMLQVGFCKVGIYGGRFGLPL